MSHYLYLIRSYLIFLYRCSGTLSKAMYSLTAPIRNACEHVLHLQFVRTYAAVGSRIHGSLRLYLQFAYVRAYIDRVARMYVKRTSARAQAYTYVCARGLPAYFGILIARGRPSPLSLLTPFRHALRPVSPHLVPYRAPALRSHPRIPVSSSPRVPLETLPIPKTLDSTRNSSHMYFHVYRLSR
jgi:hypothetical protein